MAHFSELDENNIVIRTVVISNEDILENGVESESKGIDFCNTLYGGRWIQTSYNKNFRKNFAGPGMMYDDVNDAFIAQKPFESWVLDQETYRWKAPAECPGDIKDYIWNETTTSWVEYND